MISSLSSFGYYWFWRTVAYSYRISLISFIYWSAHARWRIFPKLFEWMKITFIFIMGDKVLCISLKLSSFILHFCFFIIIIIIFILQILFETNLLFYAFIIPGVALIVTFFACLLPLQINFFLQSWFFSRTPFPLSLSRCFNKRFLLLIFICIIFIIFIFFNCNWILFLFFRLDDRFMPRFLFRFSCFLLFFLFIFLRFKIK